MATPPSFIQEADTATDSTDPKTTAAFEVLAGDLLLAYVVTDNNGVMATVSNSGSALGWTEQELVVVGNFGRVALWWTILSENRTGLTATFTRTEGMPSNYYNGNVLTFRGSRGVGQSEQTHEPAAAPAAAIRTRYDNSVLVVVVNDKTYVDGTGRIWRTGAGALTEIAYFRHTTEYTIYTGYHANAGPVALSTVGLTAPDPQKYTLAVVELVSVDDVGPVVRYTKAR